LCSASLIRFLSGCAKLADRIGGFAFNILYATRGAHDLGVLFSHVPQKSRERMPAAVANNFDCSGFLVSRTISCHSGLDFGRDQPVAQIIALGDYKQISM
jgi:hypothetical protein